MAMLDLIKPLFVPSQWPDLLSVHEHDDRIEMQLFINADLQWLQGHFPEQPVLAGVVQTHWAGTLAQHLFAPQQPLIRIDNLKFQNVILPLQNVCLELKRQTPSAAVTFRYRDPEKLDLVFSEGKLIF